jgi:tetratricopeptide (TPR) repeat protein
MFFNLFKISCWKSLLVNFYAIYLFDKEKYEKVISYLTTFLNNEKNYITESHYYILGRAYLEIKDYGKARESFLVSLENDPSVNVYKANTYFLLGLTYYETKDFLRAIEQFQLAAEIKKDIKFKRDHVISLPHIYCYLARAYKNLDQRDKALEIVNRGLSYEPSNKALQRELTILSARQKDKGVRPSDVR